MKNVIALFDSIADAHLAYNALIGSNIEKDRISVVTRPPSSHYDSEAGEGAGIGAATGAVAGGIATFLASLGAMAIPGIGPVLGLGTLLATLTGVGVGAAAGSLIGGLVGLGIPHPEAEIYAEGIHRGATLITVDATDNDADTIAAILSRNHAVDIDRRAADWQAAGWQRKHPSHRDKIQEKKAIEALQSGNIGGPTVTPSARGVDRAYVPNAGASIGSIGVGLNESIGDLAGTRRQNARIYNPT